MGKWILTFIGILSVIYGIIVSRVGSGTLFWLIWEAIGGFFFLWAFLLHSNFFASHKKLQIIFYLAIILAGIMFFIFCSMIIRGFRSEEKKNLDYVIVLGAQMRADGPSTVLKYRLDKAIEYLNENPDTVCIVSGGQGINEPYPEAEGMYEYLVENGINRECILIENKSNSTVENIIFSRELMKEDYEGVGIITNNFHVYRALKIAEKQKLEGACGIAAKSNALYLPNNVLRECCAILKGILLHHI